MIWVMSLSLINSDFITLDELNSLNCCTQFVVFSYKVSFIDKHVVEL